MQKNHSQSRRGAVAVEFAFIAPVLLSIVFGVLELTRIYDAQYLLETAAREGARFAAMDRDGMVNDGETANSKITEDIKNFLETAGLPRDQLQVDILDHADPTQTFDLDDPANDLALFDVEIKIPYSSVAHTPVDPNSDYNLTGSITFRNGRATLSH